MPRDNHHTPPPTSTPPRPSDALLDALTGPLTQRAILHTPWRLLEALVAIDLRRLVPELTGDALDDAAGRVTAGLRARAERYTMELDDSDHDHTGDDRGEQRLRLVAETPEPGGDR